MGRGEISLGDIGGVLIIGQLEWVLFLRISMYKTYLVSLVGGGSSDLTLVARSKLGEITVVVTLPVYRLFNHAP